MEEWEVLKSQIRQVAHGRKGLEHLITLVAINAVRMSEEPEFVDAVMDESARICADIAKQNRTVH